MTPNTPTRQGLDPDRIITRLESASDVSGLPCGVAVGDRFGGRSFTDNVAAALERRSFRGWSQLDEWTLIVIDHG